MKKILIALTPAILLLAGCGKNLEESYISTYTSGLDNVGKLKINVASVYRANPSFQIKINDTRVSSLITARTPFPGGGYNTSGSSYGDYITVPVGANKISLSIPKVGTNTDSVLLFETNFTMADNKNYSLQIADTAANTKTALLPENLTLPMDSFPYYKFVNLMPNVPAVDLYLGTTLKASNIKYLEASAEFKADSLVATTWYIRESGTGPTGATLASYATGSTLTPNRKFTAFAMGYKGITVTTDPRRPFVSFYLTR